MNIDEHAGSRASTRCLAFGRRPGGLEKANAVPIFKKRDHCIYRPVSLTSSTTNVMEHSSCETKLLLSTDDFSDRCVGQPEELRSLVLSCVLIGRTLYRAVRQCRSGRTG